MAITVNTTTINITDATYTLDTLTTAIADIAVLEKTGTGPYTYTVKGSSGIQARQLEIGDGGNITLEQNDTLTWDIPTSLTSDIALDIQYNGIFTAEDGTTISFPYNASHPCRMGNYGEFYLIGTSGNHITIDGADDCQIHSRPEYPEDKTTVSWNYVDMINPFDVASPMIYLTNYYGTKPKYSFTNISINGGGDAAGVGDMGYPIYITGDSNDYTNVNIDGWTVQGVSYMAYISTPLKFKNSTFTNVGNYLLGYTIGFGGHHIREYHYQTSMPYSNGCYQPVISWENCIFENNYCNSSSEMAFASYYGGVHLLKNCTFRGIVSDVSTYGVRGVYGAKIILLKDNTFGPYLTNNYGGGTSLLGGGIYDGVSIDLRVYDLGGNPIEGATVSITQSNGYETWNFKTDSNGRILNCHGDLPFAIRRQIIENSNDPAYNEWSNNIEEGRYHLITVSKETFQTWAEKFEMEDDKTIEVRLKPITSFKGLPQ